MAFVALATLAVAGCGGGGALSMAQLRDRATQICGTAARESAAIPAPAVPARTEPFLRRGTTVLGPELEKLHALKPPSDVADVYATAVRAFSLKLEALNRTLRGIERGDDPVGSIKSLQQRLSPIESSEDGAWRALEIPACLNR